MITLTRAIVVEGKYDASRLANLVDATILTTDGTSVFKNKKMQELFKRLGRSQGLILLTDSDAAGFRIRHFVTGLVGAEYVLQAYVPAVKGKERRKQTPGKEGLLGVEGVSDELILEAIENAMKSDPHTISHANSDETAAKREILYSDLYEWGLTGQAGSAERKRAFLEQLGLPPRLSKKELIQVLNTLYTYEGLEEQLHRFFAASNAVE